MDNSVATAILGFTAIGLGLFAWSFAFGQLNIQTTRYSQEAGAVIMQTSSFLAIEDVAFKGGTIYLTLFNAGTIPLQITSITVNNPGDGLTYNFQNHGLLRVQEYHMYDMPGVRVPGMVIRVHALPEALFDDADPSLNAQWGITVEWKE